MKTPWGEVDIPFIQNPFSLSGSTVSFDPSGAKQGSVPFLQNPFNGRPGVAAGFLPTVIKPAAAGKKVVSPTPVPTGGQVQAAATDSGGFAGYGGGGGYYDAQGSQDEAERGTLRNEVRARQAELMKIYDMLFGDIDTLARDKSGETRKKYGGQRESTAKQYASSIPKIENSYAAIGAGDSTDTRDAKVTAKEGFDTANKTIQENENADLGKIGQYVNEQKSRWGAEREGANRLVSRIDDTKDLGDLRASRNSFEDKITNVNADRGTLMTDTGARGQLSAITGDNGRFDSVIGALDAITKSALAGGVKQAAVEAVSNSAGLTPEERDRIKLQYGNVY